MKKIRIDNRAYSTEDPTWWERIGRFFDVVFGVLDKVPAPLWIALGAALGVLW